MILFSQQRPTITAGAYTSGDAVGGLLTFNISLNGHGNGIISGSLVDLAKQNITMDLVLFTQTFAALADNAPFDPVDADMVNFLGVLSFSSYSSFVDSSVAMPVSTNLIYHSTDPLGKLYGQLVCRGAYTGSATNDIIVNLWSLLT